MTTTFTGLYTRNNGTQPAAGTVAVTPDGGGTTTFTLDATGAIPAASTVAFAPRYTIVDTITGATTRTRTVQVLNDAQTVDLSRDVGHDGATPLNIGAAKIFATTGVPTDVLCPGAANGDIAVRLDATHGTNNTLYQRQAGAWVGLA